MPLPHRLAQFNKKVTNRIARPIAGWAPGLGIIHHVGRRTGTRYETVVNVFRREDGYLFALTYGETERLRNVLAASGCDLVTRGKRYRLVDPVVFTDPGRQDVPAPVRVILGLVEVDQFLTMRIEA